MDLNFNSASSTPFVSAPSSPKLFGEMYFSAPTSPTRSSALYGDFNNISFVQRTSTSCDASPLERKSNDAHLVDQDDFAFEFSGQIERPSSTADELFEMGKIRPFRPPQHSSVSSPKSPKPSTEKTKVERNSYPSAKISKQERGSEKVSYYSSKSSHRSTRSLSDFVFEEEQEQSTTPISSNSKSSSYSFFTKWRLKGFLLFRSASEGRATDKKYTGVSKRREDQRNSSFRSTDGSSSSGSMSKRPVSAHELIYTSKRAVQDELKRKTYLPYNKGLLGCVGFNPTVEGLAKGINSIKRG